MMVILTTEQQEILTTEQQERFRDMRDLHLANYKCEDSNDSDLIQYNNSNTMIEGAYIKDWLDYFSKNNSLLKYNKKVILDLAERNSEAFCAMLPSFINQILEDNISILDACQISKLSILQMPHSSDFTECYMNLRMITFNLDAIPTPVSHLSTEFAKIESVRDLFEPGRKILIRHTDAPYTERHDLNDHDAIIDIKTFCELLDPYIRPPIISEEDYTYDSCRFVTSFNESSYIVSSTRRSMNLLKYFSY